MEELLEKENTIVDFNKENKLHLISQIILPTSEFINNTELFIKHEFSDIDFDGSIKKVGIYKLNTWMNMFAGKKYNKYCDFNNLYLNLEIEGHYKLLITGSTYNVAYDVTDEIISDTYCDGNVTIKIPNFENYDGIYFTIIEDLKNPIKFKGGYWATDTNPTYDNKIAIICCTYKREKYITKNIELFKMFIENNQQIRDKISLYIVDNGKTLPLELNSDNIHIYPNINAGGAGGFTRGVLEVLKSEQNYTRVLFMDDDVVFCPESFYRTLNLSNYLKPEYKNSVINGAMLDLYERNMFYESMAIQTKSWVTPYHKCMDLDEYVNVLKSNITSDDLFNNPNQKVSSAWWFCSFELDTFKQEGLPISLFFRCDDIEYSWRNFGKTHIQMNGICVWHAPFRWRTSKVVDYYYSKRNYFMVNMIHTPNYKKQMFKTIKKDFAKLLRKYDYISCEIYLKMMEDLLKGSQTFKQNPETQFKEVNFIEKQRVYEHCEYKEVEKASWHNSRKKILRCILYVLTCKGLFAPKFLFKKYDISLDENSIDFMMRKKVKVYNLLTNKCEIREYTPKQVYRLKKEFNHIFKQLKNNYDKLQQDFITMQQEMKTVTYWEKYLGV